ncbi:MAG: Fructose-1,6-bisphosphatase [Candidatus Pacebacteria bacterium GW2011_GWB1_47_8]|nr:MAG: Fructose-1,6-bisphosphatase [Candidatus Pacebacteria bacterium GW2011_GWA1_46_10]KKU84310.1 MAG: Fructose-1,6-bisphosphatase [Candidatus Pacebacteria bacterium GW2011_GWB1_47_8]
MEGNRWVSQLTIAMEDTFALQLSHATEVGAIGAARAAGFGNKKGADQAAVEAMRTHLNSMRFSGRIVIGEGERDEAPMLYIGEKVGKGNGQAIDIAVDPLENTNATATLGPSALSVLAASERGGLFHAPDMYMNKLVVPPEAVGKVHLDDPVKTTLKTLARVLKRAIQDLTVTVLDRDRHEELIAQIREAGARVRLIPDGDLIPGVAVCMRGTGVHAVMGIGAAPEGVMTAAALRCVKGEMQARFWPKNDQEKTRLKKMGGDPQKIYSHQELASGKTIIFCATGVTTGEFLKGVRFFGGGARTHTLVMTNQSGKIRFIDTTHVFDKKAINYHLT